MIKINDLYLKKKIPEISHLNLQVENGESYVLLSAGDIPIDHLINILLGLEKGFKGTVEIDNIDIRSDRDYSHENILFLSSGTQWPGDMKVGNIVSFLEKSMDIPGDEFEDFYIKLNIESIYQRRINEIEEAERRRILFSLAQLKKSKNYIVRNFAKGMPLDFNLEFKKGIGQLKKKGCSILYFSDDVFIAPEIGDRIGFMKKGRLLLELKASKMRKMSSRELYFQFLAEV
jgi:ABC-type multidrug transport system ATPase subunit